MAVQATVDKEKADPAEGFTTAHQAALRYLRAGFSVIPIKENKTPALNPGFPFLKQKPTLEDLDAWYQGKPYLGVGIACGAVSSHLQVLDIEYSDIWEQFAELLKAELPGLLVRMPRVSTPGKQEGYPGYHLYFRSKVEPPGQKLARLTKEEAEQRTGDRGSITGIEIKFSGYVVAPGSPGSCHPSGRTYEHLDGPPIEETPTITDEEAEGIYRCARALDRAGAEDAAKKESREWTQQRSSKASGSSTRPGDRFNQLASWDDVFQGTGWNPWRCRGDVQYWTRPGKESGASASTGHCHNDSGDLLYVFSSNAAPFEDGKAYNKFRAFTLLQHGGDFRAAAKAAAALFPDPERPGARTGDSDRGGNQGDTEAAVQQNHGEYFLTDTGNAKRIVDNLGTDLKYCHPWRSWIHWDGKKWNKDITGAVPRLVKELTIQLSVNAMNQQKKLANDDPQLPYLKELKKHFLSWQNATKLENSIKLAQSEAGIPVLPESFNSDPYLLNCKNGTIDLRTGELKPHCRGDLISQICPVAYDPGADCKRFKRAIQSIFKDDQEVIQFVQRSLGYSLTGLTNEHILPIWHGSGSNGKSTLIEAILGTLGTDYSGVVTPDLLMQTFGDQHPTGLADLFGKRLMIASETGEGKRLNEERIKMLTGGDRIKARQMRQDFWEFVPTHKLILITNHKPKVGGDDHAIWRRLRLVPFEKQFLNPADPANSGREIKPDERVDKTLGQALSQEREGILAWMVQGCLEWQCYGLPIPESIRAATNEYRSNEDVLANFISEKCVVNQRDHSYRTKASVLFEAYRNWCKTTNERDPKQTDLGRKMKERGFEKYTNNGTWYLGIRLNPMADGTEDNGRTEG